MVEVYKIPSSGSHASGCAAHAPKKPRSTCGMNIRYHTALRRPVLASLRDSGSNARACLLAASYRRAGTKRGAAGTRGRA